MTEARWLDAGAAADYLSIRVDAFLRAVRDGKIPRPSHHLGVRTARWDRNLLDATMSGGTASTDTRSAFDALAEEIKAQGQESFDTSWLTAHPSKSDIRPTPRSRSSGQGTRSPL